MRVEKYTLFKIKTIMQSRLLRFDQVDTTNVKFVTDSTPKPVKNPDGGVFLRYFGTIKCADDGPLRIQTPYLRTPRGLVESTYNNKKDYHLELSLLPPNDLQKSVPANAPQLGKFVEFVESLESTQHTFLRDQLQTWLGNDINEFEVDQMQKSLIKRSDDGYPPKFSFRMNTMLNADGEFQVPSVKGGGELKQLAFDTETDTIVPLEGQSAPSDASIKDIEKQARLRLQMVASGWYLMYNSTEPSRCSFGIKWTIEHILFYNSPYLGKTQPQEEVFTSFNFTDITESSIDAPAQAKVYLTTRPAENEPALGGTDPKKRKVASSGNLE